MSKKDIKYTRIKKKKFTKNRKKRIKKSTKKNKIKAFGKEYLIPYSLTRFLEKHGVYEPGIVKIILHDISIQDVKKGIMQEKFEKNKKRIIEIDNLLKDPKILQTDGPSRCTRSKEKKDSWKRCNKFNKLISEKERLIKENYFITH